MSDNGRVDDQETARGETAHATPAANTAQAIDSSQAYAPAVSARPIAMARKRSAASSSSARRPAPPRTLPIAASGNPRGSRAGTQRTSAPGSGASPDRYAPGGPRSEARKAFE